MKEQLKTSKVEKFLSSNRTKNLLQQTKTHLTHTKHTTVEKKKKKPEKQTNRKEKNRCISFFGFVMDGNVRTIGFPLLLFVLFHKE